MNILDVLNQKIELFDRVLELSNRQSEMLENDDVEKLNDFTNKKQALIDKLEEIDKINAHVISDKKEITDESKQLNNRLRAIINEVLKIDKRNNETTRSMIDQHAVEIKKINSDKRKLHLYSKKSVSSDGIYIDKRK